MSEDYLYSRALSLVIEAAAVLDRALQEGGLSRDQDNDLRSIVRDLDELDRRLKAALGLSHRFADSELRSLKLAWRDASPEARRDFRIFVAKGRRA